MGKHSAAAVTQQPDNALGLTKGYPEMAVHDRYSHGAQVTVQELCCPVNYDPQYLAAIPPEVLERDYGCGDPTEFVRPGDVVLDLGSGGGKICYIAAQLAGPTGRVIGVDCNVEMLSLARRSQAEVAKNLGYSNVDFRCGLIQDLRLDLDLLAQELAVSPIQNQHDWLQLRGREERLRRDSPLVADASVDCVLSNCVLNLVRTADRQQLFGEMFRVLKRGGRVAISDIVADEDVPDDLQREPLLWSGCIAGAFREDLFLKAFEDTGFHGIHIARRGVEPWRVVEGIEFRSVTVVAFKGKQGPCLERNQALVYQGPFRKVEDDDGHLFVRGQRTAVCDKTFELLQREPYGSQFAPVPPLDAVPHSEAQPFDCRRSRLRDPRETKGADYRVTVEGIDCCDGNGACC